MNYFDSPDEICRRQDGRLELEARERQAALETMASNKRKAQAALTEFAEKMTQLCEPVTVWKNGRQGKSPIGIDLTIKGSDGSKVDEIAGWLVATDFLHESILFYIRDCSRNCLLSAKQRVLHSPTTISARKAILYVRGSTGVC